MKVTLVLTVFDRLEFLKRTWDSLCGCKEFSCMPVLCGVDGPRECSEPSVSYLKNRGVHRFYEFDTNKGPTNNVVRTVDQAFQAGADAVIHLEDDIVVSKDYLRFMLSCLGTFKDFTCYGVRVWSVDGDSELLDMKPSHDLIEPSSWFVTLGWATWRDRWDYFMETEWKRRSEDPDLIWGRMLNNARMSYGGVRVYPRASRVSHIGWYGKHMTKEHAAQQGSTEESPNRSAPNFQSDHEWDKLVLDITRFQRESCMLKKQRVKGRITSKTLLDV